MSVETAAIQQLQEALSPHEVAVMRSISILSAAIENVLLSAEFSKEDIFPIMNARFNKHSDTAKDLGVPIKFPAEELTTLIEDGLDNSVEFEFTERTSDGKFKLTESGLVCALDWYLRLNV